MIEKTRLSLRCNIYIYNIHDACAALACLSHKEFGTCDTTCINTNVFLIPVRDIVRFDNDAIVGKASENSRDVGSRVQKYTRVRSLKVHELEPIKIQCLIVSTVRPTMCVTFCMCVTFYEAFIQNDPNLLGIVIFF